MPRRKMIKLINARDKGKKLPKFNVKYMDLSDEERKVVTAEILRYKNDKAQDEKKSGPINEEKFAKIYEKFKGGIREVFSDIRKWGKNQEKNKEER